MKLDPAQRDVLVEAINVGAGHAGKQLSMLISDTVEMHVPQVDLVDYEELPGVLELEAADEVVCVRQDVGGAIAGQVLLFFRGDDSRHLLQALIGPMPVAADIDLRRFEQEAMTEIGNIVIAAHVSAMADFFGAPIRLKPPDYAEGTLHDVLGLPAYAPVHGRAAFVIHCNLRALRRAVSGMLVIMFSTDDMRFLLERLDAILARIATS